MSKSLLSELRTGYAAFSATEKKIVDVLLSDPHAFVQYTITQLAAVAVVSQGSIANFSNKFAGGGFPALKLRVAGELFKYEHRPFSTVEQTDSVRDVLKKAVDNTALALRHTVEVNGEESLRRAAEMILAAKRVEIYGLYRSAAVATDLYYQLLQVGIPASFVGDVFSCSISAAMLSGEGLVIVVSASGETKEIIDAVTVAKENGAPVICLTGNGCSPMAVLSDCVLVAASGDNTIEGQASEIRRSQLVIADALCMYLRTKMDESGTKGHTGLQSILTSHNVND